MQPPDGKDPQGLFRQIFLPVLAPAVGHHGPAVGLGADGIGGHVGCLLEGGVDHMALIGVHGLQGHVPAVLDHLARHLVGQTDKGLLPLGPVALGIHVDAHPLGLAVVDGIAGELLGKTGEHLTINHGFKCDYGTNITVGEHFYANYNLVVLDCAPVVFGDNVFIAPNCGFYAAGHPIDAPTRNSGLEFAKPITVGDNVWIGGNVTVLPGVTIGSGAVIGAGSVVTHDIPPNVVAVGNPCRPVRDIV